MSIKIGRNEVVALLDTGSDVTAMALSEFRRVFGDMELSGPAMHLVPVGRGHLKTLGSFSSKFKIADQEFLTQIHVLPEGLALSPMLIGRDVIAKNTVIVNNDGVVSITKTNINETALCESVNIHKVEGDWLWNKAFEGFNEISYLEENIVDVNHIMNDEVKIEIKSLVSKYNPKKLEKSLIEMNILLNDNSPVHRPPRRLAPLESAVVEKQIDEWIREGIIRESTSEYASPIVVVRKKDGTHRICVDYRELNAKIVKDRYPLPLIEDVLESFCGARVFTTLDLKNGFFHVDVDKASVKYTAFVTPGGQYEFLKVPF